MRRCESHQNRQQPCRDKGKLGQKFCTESRKIDAEYKKIIKKKKKKTSEEERIFFKNLSNSKFGKKNKTRDK